MADRSRRGFLAAVQFLTRVPVRTARPPDLAAAVVWFPVVGALVGAAVGGRGRRARRARAGRRGGGGRRARRRAGHRVRSTRTGWPTRPTPCAGGWTARAAAARSCGIRATARYGVAALCGSIVLRIVAVASLGPAAAFAGLVAAHTLGRGAAVVAMGVGAAGPAGRARAPTTPRPSATGTGRRRRCVVAVAIAAVATGWWVAPAGARGRRSPAVRRRRRRRPGLGGITGDVLGAIEQVAECAVLVVVTGLALRHDVWWSVGSVRCRWRTGC